ncbi:MAG: hypothetical protein ABR923_06815 [Terracidiphilus sp.]
MPLQHVDPGGSARLDTRPRFELRGKAFSILFYLFFGISALALFIPLNPRMPTKGLDSSWQFAMNEAVARHMSFGGQVMFTYGPYASILTRTYSPATERRMLLGSLMAGLSFSLALLYLERGRKKFITVLLLLFLATYGNPELLLLSYAFLFSVCVLKQREADSPGKAFSLGWWQTSAAIVMIMTLGLLPLGKGSLVLPFVAAGTIPAAFLAYQARLRQALIVLFLPMAATVILWIAAGQTLANLPIFLRGTVLLASGYTEAMSMPWTILPPMIGDGLVLASLAITGLVLASIARSAQLTPAPKCALALLFIAFQFVAFKHGIVKSEGLSGIFASLAVSIFIICFLYMDRLLLVALSISVLLTVGTAVQGDATLNREVHERFGAGVTWSGEKRPDIFRFCLDRALGAYSRTTYANTWKTYRSMWDGIGTRMSRSNGLAAHYSQAVKDIENDYPLPMLKGAGDVYSYEQSVLLASGNAWDPRPVFQSYSAYTPELAMLNEQHLRGPGAPDWIIIDLQSIEGRLPSLDDGASWPALFDNYEFTSYDSHYVLMQRKQATRLESEFENVVRETCETGKTVAIPQTKGLLFAAIDLKPTLLGRFLTVVFNPPQLHIVLHLSNGQTKRYRVVAGMMSTGFLLSPFVSDTKDFAALVNPTNTHEALDGVDSISVDPSYGRSLFWSGTYSLTLMRYVGN